MATPLTRIQLRRGNSSLWDQAGVLAEGEPAFEPDTNYLRIGDGATQYQDLLVFIPRPPTYLSFAVSTPVSVQFQLLLTGLTTSESVVLRLFSKTRNLLIQSDTIDTGSLTHTMNLAAPLVSNEIYYTEVCSTSLQRITISNDVTYAPVSISLDYIDTDGASAAVNWTIGDYTYNIGDEGLYLRTYIDGVMRVDDFTVPPDAGTGNAIRTISPAMTHGQTAYFAFADKTENIIAKTKAIQYNSPGLFIRITDPSTLEITLRKDVSISSYINTSLYVQLGGVVVYTSTPANFTANTTVLNWESEVPLTYGTYTCNLGSPPVLTSSPIDYTPIEITNVQYVDATTLTATINYNSGQFFYDQRPVISVRTSSADGLSTSFLGDLSGFTLAEGIATYTMTSEEALVSGSYHMVAVDYSGALDTVVSSAVSATAFVQGTATFGAITLGYFDTYNTANTTFNLGAAGTFPQSSAPVFTLNDSSGAPVASTVEIYDGATIVAAPYTTNKTYTLRITSASLLAQGSYKVYMGTQQVGTFSFTPFNLAITSIGPTTLTTTFQSAPSGSTLALLGTSLTRTLASTDTSYTFTSTFVLGANYTATISTPGGGPVSTQTAIYAYPGVTMSTLNITSNTSYAVSLQITSAAVTTLSALAGTTYYIRAYTSADALVDEFVVASISGYTALTQIPIALASGAFQIGGTYTIRFMKDSTLIANIRNFVYAPLAVGSFGVRDKYSLYSTIAWTSANISPLRLSVYRSGSPATLVASQNISAGSAGSTVSYVISSGASAFVNGVASTYTLRLETQTGIATVYTHGTALTGLVDTQFAGTMEIKDLMVFSPVVSPSLETTDGKISVFFQYSGFSAGVLFPDKTFPFAPSISVKRLPDTATASPAVTYSTATYYQYTAPTYTTTPTPYLNYGAGVGLIADPNVAVPANSAGSGLSRIYRVDLTIPTPPKCGIYTITGFGTALSGTPPSFTPASYTASTRIFYPLTLATDFRKETTYVSTLKFLNRKEYYVNLSRSSVSTNVFAAYPPGTQYLRYTTRADNGEFFYTLYGGILPSGTSTAFGGSPFPFVAGQTTFALTTNAFVPDSNYFAALYYNEADNRKSIITNMASQTFTPAAPTVGTPALNSTLKTITFTFSYLADDVLFNKMFVPKVGISTTSSGTSYTYAPPVSATITPSGATSIALSLVNGYEIEPGTQYTVVMKISDWVAARYYRAALFTPPDPADDDTQFLSGTNTPVESLPVFYDPIVISSIAGIVASNLTNLSFAFTVSSGGSNLNAAMVTIKNTTQNNTTIMSPQNLMSGSAPFPGSLAAGNYTIVLTPTAQAATYSSLTKTFTFGVTSTSLVTNKRFDISNLYTLTLALDDSVVSPVTITSNSVRYSPPGYDIIILAGETNMTGADGQTQSSGFGSSYVDPDSNMRWSQSLHTFLSQILVANAAGYVSRTTLVTNPITTTGLMRNYSFRGTQQTNMTERNVSMGEEFVGYYMTYVKEPGRKVIVIPASDRRSGFFADLNQDGLDAWRSTVGNYPANGAAKARVYLVNQGTTDDPIPQLQNIMTNEAYKTISGEQITRVAACLWHQGEYDAVMGSTAWHTEIKALKTAIDTRLATYDPNYSDYKYPFIVSQMPQTWSLGKSLNPAAATYINNCNSFISSTTLLGSNALCVSSLGMTGILYDGDDATERGDISSCFSNRSQRLLAARYMSAYLSIPYTAQASSTAFPSLEPSATTVETPQSLSFSSPYIRWRSCSNSWNTALNASFYYADVTYGTSTKKVVLTECVSRFSDTSLWTPDNIVPFEASVSTTGWWIPGITTSNTAPQRYSTANTTLDTAITITSSTNTTVVLPSGSTIVSPIYREFRATSAGNVTTTPDYLRLDMSLVLGTSLSSFKTITIYAVSSTITKFTSVSNGATYTNTFENSLRASAGVTLSV